MNREWLTFRTKPLKSQISAAAGALFSVNTHCRTFPLSDETDAHFIGQHYQVCLLKVKVGSLDDLFLQSMYRSLNHGNICIQTDSSVTMEQ